MVKELFDINKLVNFVLVEVHSNKKNQDYYAIAIKVKNDIHIIKFLTKNQADVIIK